MKCRARLAPLLFPLTLIVACASPAATPQPEPPGAPSAPPPEVSLIVVPIRASLAPLSTEIEARVEKTFKGKATERGIDIDYNVARDPVRLQMIGGGLHASTTVKYAMQACRGRFPCISCGIGEPRRQAEITLHSKLEWDPAWRLRSTTKLLPVHYATACTVTWLDIDITRRFIAPVIEQQLGAAARIIDHNTPALTNIRPQAEQIWTSLQTPTELAPRTWLVLDPIDVALTPISGAGLIVTSTLSLHANARVVVGAKPAVARKPLPALRVAAASPGGMRVPFDVELPYDEASALASREFAGKKFDKLKVESIRLSPSGSGRVLVEALIDYRGGALRNYHGLVYLEGTPRFDAATSSVVVPDLEYTLDPKRRGLFTAIREHLAHETIRARLRENARFPLATQIAVVRTEITRALNRTLAPGVTLHGQADAIEPVSVTPLASGLSVRVIATGRAEVGVR